MAEHPTPHPDVAGYVLGVLSPAEAEDFSRHLATCAPCRTEVVELAALPGFLRAWAEAPADELPDELRERTLTAVDRVAGDAAGGRAGGAGSISAGVLDRMKARWPRPVIVGATLVLLAVVGVVIFAGRDEGPTAATVPLTAVAGERGGGEATISRSWEGLVIRLSLSGLAPNPSGTHYECWYLSQRDSPQRPDRISGGTFTVREGGTADVVLTVAADRQRYPGIAITFEHDDGDPATTGQVVLVTRPR